MKTFKQFQEDIGGAISANAAGVCSVGNGDIAGTGGLGGEPGVNPKKKKGPILAPLMTRKS